MRRAKNGFIVVDDKVEIPAEKNLIYPKQKCPLSLFLIYSVNEL